MIRTVKDQGDKYGRWLATVIWPGNPESINDHMINAGFAVPYDGGKR